MSYIKRCVYLWVLMFLLLAQPVGKGQVVSPGLEQDQFLPAKQLRHPLSKTHTEGANANLFLPYSYYATNLCCTLFTHLDAVAVADFNGDGRNDVALTTSYISPIPLPRPDDGGLYIYYQNANGKLGTPIRLETSLTINTRETSIAAGDINGDGRADIVLGNYESLQVFTQTPQGTMQPSLMVPTPDAIQVQIGDVNGDGRLDIVSLGYETNQLRFTIWQQTAQGQLAAPKRVPIPKIGGGLLALGDVNGDKRLDVVVTGHGTSGTPDVQVFLQASDGTFPPPVEYDVDGQRIEGIAVGDITGDGLDDVVLTFGTHNVNPEPPGLAVLAQSATHMLSAPRKYSTLDVPQVATIADVNRDGLLDVVITHWGWENVGVYLQGSDGQLQAEELFAIPENINGQNAQGLAVADINGDGENDILVTDNYQRKLILLYHQSPNEIPPEITVTSPNGNENLVPGSNIEITWTASSSVKKVRIEYSIDTLNFIPLATSAPNTGSFTWKVPERGTSRGIIRIFDDSGRAWDTNDEYFNIVSCEMTLTPIDTFFILVSTGPTCTWETKADPEFFTIERGARGTGSDIIKFNYKSTQDRAPYTKPIRVGNAQITIAVPGNFTSVDAARYQEVVAPESIVAGFGGGLAPGVAFAPSIPLPTSLLGSQVIVKDRYNVDRLAPLFYVSPTQINYQVPAGTAIGQATVTVITVEGSKALGTLLVKGLSYGIFSADSSGKGPAAAYAVRVKGITQTVEQTVRYDEMQKQWINIPIDLDSFDEDVVLVLHGTGIRFHNPARPVRVIFGNEEVVAEYAGPQGAFVGLDQINVRLPKTLRGRGEVSLLFFVDDIYANIVTVAIK